MSKSTELVDAVPVRHDVWFFEESTDDKIDET